MSVNKIISHVELGIDMAKDDDHDNEEEWDEMDEFQKLPIREQNAVLYEEFAFTVVPMLEMILRILNGGDDFANE